MTRLHCEMEHLKIETRLINEEFVSLMGECVIVTSKVCHLSIFKVIRSVVVMLFIMNR